MFRFQVGSQTAHSDSIGYWVSWCLGCLAGETPATPRGESGEASNQMGERSFLEDRWGRLGQSGAAKTWRAQNLVRARVRPLALFFQERVALLSFFISGAGPSPGEP